MAAEVTFVDECASTNSAIAPDAPHGYALAAVRQSAGRGQRGSSWESEPGMNLTMSVMLRPVGVAASGQFAISQAVALAVAETLDYYGVPDVAVKWPNDVYAGGNRKICGILIENSLSGRMVSRSVAGIGLNVNQLTWRSDAPNPVSMRELTGRVYDVREVGERVVSRLLELIERPADADIRPRLWRGEGVWPWVTADGVRFEGRIDGILPSGEIVIGGRRFAFKEVWPGDMRDPGRRM